MPYSFYFSDGKGYFLILLPGKGCDGGKVCQVLLLLIKKCLVIGVYGNGGTIAAGAIKAHNAVLRGGVHISRLTKAGNAVPIRKGSHSDAFPGGVGLVVVDIRLGVVPGAENIRFVILADERGLTDIDNEGNTLGIGVADPSGIGIGKDVALGVFPGKVEGHTQKLVFFHILSQRVSRAGLCLPLENSQNAAGGEGKDEAEAKCQGNNLFHVTSPFSHFEDPSRWFYLYCIIYCRGLQWYIANAIRYTAL